MAALLSFQWSEYWPFILLAVIGLLSLATRPLVQQRNRRLRQFAESHGFAAIRKPQRDMKALKLLGQGHSRSFEHAYERTADLLTIRFFEYSYFLHIPPAAVGYMQTVIAFRVPGQELFAFQLTPATTLGKLGVKLGLENIVLYESTMFSQRYRLRGGGSQRCPAALPPGAGAHAGSGARRTGVDDRERGCMDDLLSNWEDA
jgi:hypothetical protein